MPHLMNCPHSPNGWCLDCVKEEHDKSEATIEDLMAVCERQKKELLIRRNRELNLWRKDKKLRDAFEEWIEDGAED